MTFPRAGDSRSVQRQLTDVMQVYVSEFACAAITNDGTVVSWGSAIAGGDNHDVRNKLVNVREITATNSAFAAIKLDGSVISWGDPRNGGCCEEVQKELFDVQKIFASSTAFAAIRSDGKVVTWGAKNAGGDSQAQKWRPTLATKRLAELTTLGGLNRALNCYWILTIGALNLFHMIRNLNII